MIHPASYTSFGTTTGMHGIAHDSLEFLLRHNEKVGLTTPGMLYLQQPSSHLLHLYYTVLLHSSKLLF